MHTDYSKSVETFKAVIKDQQVITGSKHIKLGHSLRHQHAFFSVKVSVFDAHSRYSSKKPGNFSLTLEIIYKFNVEKFNRMIDDDLFSTIP